MTVEVEFEEPTRLPRSLRVVRPGVLRTTMLVFDARGRYKATS